MIFFDNDEQVLDYIYNLLKHKLYSCKKKIYLKTDIIWIDNLEEISAELLIFISELPIYKNQDQDKNQDLVSYTKYYNKTNSFINKIIKRVKTENIKDDLLDLFITSTKNKIIFNNGYIDFTSKKFYELDSSIYTRIKIDRGFDTRLDYKYVLQVKKILTSIFGDNNLDYVLRYLARVISDSFDPDQELDFYFRACTLGGKSTVFELIYNSFSDYISSSLIQDKYKRLIFINNYDDKFTRIKHNNKYRIFYMSVYKLKKTSNINYIEMNNMFLSSDDKLELDIRDENILEQDQDILDRLVFTKEYNDALVYLLLEYI